MYLRRDIKCITSPREIAIDTGNYLTAPRACLHYAPDMILLGEIRDAETSSTAMIAAESGRLILAPLHINGAVNTIDRILASFPSGKQDQFWIQLSSVLHTMISQKLFPGIHGNIVPNHVTIHMRSTIKSFICIRKSQQIHNAINASSAEGMISMDQSILNLYEKKPIDKQTAVRYAVNTEC